MSREIIRNTTKNLLKTSLLELLEKKTLSKITIKELCEKADINRTTYYKYYLDQYDQLDKIENEIFNDMSIYIESISDDNIKDNEKQNYILRSVLIYMKENQKEFKILLEKADINFQTKCLSFMGKKVFQNIKYKDKNKEIEYIYKAVGSFGIIVEWIKDNLDLGIDELTKILINLNNK